MRWCWPWRKGNGGQAKEAREQAEAKLRQVRRDGPWVERAANTAAEWSPEEYAARVAAAFGRRRYP